jgi:thiamine biosynthesis lipoprotein
MKTFLILIVTLLSLYGCNTSSKENLTEYKYQVETMGTFGTIKYIDNQDKEQQINHAIDSILKLVNQSMSTYIENSEISNFSKVFGTDEFPEFQTKLSDEFIEVLAISDELYQLTNGAFNPLVLPLINYWGFGPEVGKNKIDSNKINSILKCIDYQKFIEARKNYSQDSTLQCFELDFSAIAKGYGVDLIAYYLNDIGIENYMVEIGGEVNCKGKNSKNKLWKIGVETPNEMVRSLYASIEIENKAMATSGNYRNFKTLESGQKVVHIINPNSGYSVNSNLLSATILANDCATADALATACMVMGWENCFKLVESQPDIHCFLIFSDQNGTLKNTYSSEIAHLVQFLK